MSGYGANYYSYPSTRAIAISIFKLFKDSGDLFNPQLSQLLHAEIYAPNGAKDPKDCLRAMAGGAVYDLKDNFRHFGLNAAGRRLPMHPSTTRKNGKARSVATMKPKAS